MFESNQGTRISNSNSNPNDPDTDTDGDDLHLRADEASRPSDNHTAEFAHADEANPTLTRAFRPAEFQDFDTRLPHTYDSWPPRGQHGHWQAAGGTAAGDSADHPRPQGVPGPYGHTKPAWERGFSDGFDYT
ncbi:uncharacterized protein DSM5745_01026 [Aspergillus mulundensis]|uniref:Uncharacterized protein n=1 Tax=Aspergillus mulundensis TaxID=1810919 RepID=A0A3D8T5A8_9EURO|nr:hypothetical protein DSM5745_01026 [Aspergillus mulundensis]RDW93704.1 hypothetical protein DSM5745_01026 [Aspergillus mulundensis]